MSITCGARTLACRVETPLDTFRDAPERTCVDTARGALKGAYNAPACAT
jgi:hypothetical protein